MQKIFKSLIHPDEINKTTSDREMQPLITSSMI